MEITKDQVLNYVKDSQVLEDAKNFQNLDNLNIESCISDLENMLMLLKNYQKLSETNFAAGTLYRELVKKYFTEDYNSLDDVTWNVRGLPGIVDSRENIKINNSNDSKIASQCKSQFETSLGETYNLLQQLTNAFGKYKRDVKSLINDCRSYLNLINLEIEKIED